MSLYDVYNAKYGFDEESEYQKFYKDIEIRCNNLIVCGDTLPYHLRDIKPHKDLNKLRIEMELLTELGVSASFCDGYLVVRRFSKPIKDWE